MSAPLQRFLFGDEIGPPAIERRKSAERDRLAEQAARAAMEREAFARGLVQGREEASAATERRRSEALERLGTAAGGLLAEIDRREAALAAESRLFFETLARAFAGRSRSVHPLGPIADAAEEAFRHLRGVPHLAARVHAGLVDEVEALLRSLARERGFEGRVVVIGEEDIPPGDARLDWADGGIVLDGAAVEAAVACALAAAFPPAEPPSAEPAFPDPDAFPC